MTAFFVLLTSWIYSGLGHDNFDIRNKTHQRCSNVLIASILVDHPDPEVQHRVDLLRNEFSVERYLYEKYPLLFYKYYMLPRQNSFVTDVEIIWDMQGKFGRNLWFRNHFPAPNAISGWMSLSYSPTDHDRFSSYCKIIGMSRTSRASLLGVLGAIEPPGVAIPSIEVSMSAFYYFNLEFTKYAP